MFFGEHIFLASEASPSHMSLLIVLSCPPPQKKKKKTLSRFDHPQPSHVSASIGGLLSRRGLAPLPLLDAAEDVLLRGLPKPSGSAPRGLQDLEGDLAPCRKPNGVLLAALMFVLIEKKTEKTKRSEELVKCCLLERSH